MNVDKKSVDHSDVLLLKTVGVDSDHNGLVFLVCSVPQVESLQKKLQHSNPVVFSNKTTLYHSNISIYIYIYDEDSRLNSSRNRRK